MWGLCSYVDLPEGKLCSIAFGRIQAFCLIIDNSSMYLFSVQLGLTPSASAKEPEKSFTLTMDKRRRVIYIG